METIIETPANTGPESAPLPLLAFKQVRKEYPGPDGGAAVAVLDAVNFTLAAGAAMAIVGPSGCGKSTLLNLAGALDRPTAGRILMAGRDLAALDETALADVRNRDIGFVFQRHHLLPQLTVIQNIMLPLLAAGKTADRDAVYARALALMARLGLSARAGHRPAQLSGGESQRVAVARALVTRPRLILADEPTGALDRVSAEGLAEVLAELNRETGTALIVVTHSESLARRMGRLMTLRDGHLVESAPEPPADSDEKTNRKKPRGKAPEGPGTETTGGPAAPEPAPANRGGNREPVRWF